MTVRPPDRQAALDTVYRRSEEIKRAELEQAMRKLEAEGNLTDRQRAAVAEAADAVVAELLAAPRRTIREAEDAQALETALELFDPDGPA